MFSSKIVPRLRLLHTASCKYGSISVLYCTWYVNLHYPKIFFFPCQGALKVCGKFLNGRPSLPASCISQIQKLANYSTAADNTSSPRWVQLEPELEDALVPRKLSVSPLETWLSLRYSLPPLLESIQPQEDVGKLEEKVLPPISVPVMEDGQGSTTAIKCKNVLEIRRRKMNRHKYKKLLRRTKFLRRRVLEGRGRKKQVCNSQFHYKLHIYSLFIHTWSLEQIYSVIVLCRNGLRTIWRGFGDEQDWRRLQKGGLHLRFSLNSMEIKGTEETQVASSQCIVFNLFNCNILRWWKSHLFC